MRGHEALLQMRRQGLAPVSVTVTTDPECDRFVASWPRDMPAFPQLLIAPDDTPERLDLRCLVGLRVWVDGLDPERVERVAKACEAAGAKRVISVAIVAGDVTRIDDTQGALTWPN